MRNRPPRSLLLLAAIGLMTVGAACGGGGGTGAPGAPGAEKGPGTLRLGYFANITHATAIVGVEKGIFAQALGSARLVTSTFNAGPAAVEALFSDAIDATYLGPNPAVNAFAKSGGKAVRIISGAASGGASLVVRPGIDDVAGLRGRKLASPQLGGTQDVALRYWLSTKGMKTDTEGGGDVAIVPQENAQTLETFRSGDIDGAWVPEPWATRLVQEGGGKVLVDERDLWPGGRVATAELVVRTAFMREHPSIVRRLLEGQVRANDFVNQNPAEAQDVLNEGIRKITGKKLPAAVVQAAWANLAFTDDPLFDSLRQSAAHAEKLGLLERVDLARIVDLAPLEAVLRAAGRPPVGG